MATGETTNTIYDIATAEWVPVVEFSTEEFRSAKLFIQGSSVNEHQTSEVFVIHDNDRVYLREVYLIYTQDPFVTFTGNIVSNTVTVYANTALQNTDIILYGIMLEVANKSKSNNSISQDKILEAAAAMRGLYPDDTTDYVKAMTGSLYREYLVANLDRQINDAIVTLSSPAFDALPEATQQERIEQFATLITERSAEIQASIDSDLAAFSEVSTRVETGSVIANISTAYADPQSKELLDLTLNTEVRTALNSNGSSNFYES